MLIAECAMTSPTDLLMEPPLSASSFFAIIDRDMHGVIRSAALAAAVELTLFDILIQPNDLDNIARITSIPEDMLEPCLSLLCGMGLLERKGNLYVNSRISSVYLYSQSPFAQVAYVRKNSRFLKDIWCRLDQVLVEGPVSYSRDEFFRDLSLPAMAENAVCGRLQETVKEISALPGFLEFRRMIDLGGGHGLYAIALAQLNPDLEACVFDLPDIAPLAEDYIKRYGAKRVHTMAGDFFTDDFGGDYDLILSSSSPSGKSTGLLAKIADALKRGGFFVNVQSPGDDPSDMYKALEWQLWTLGKTRKESGVYAKEKLFMTPQYRQAMQDAGLSIFRETAIRDDYHAGSIVKAVIAKKV